MYRVELKAFPSLLCASPISQVPNVPCGVERLKCLRIKLDTIAVPNVPCGVESDPHGTLFSLPCCS